VRVGIGKLELIGSHWGIVVSVGLCELCVHLVRGAKDHQSDADEEQPVCTWQQSSEAPLRQSAADEVWRL
jgi:hypothetical protein